MKLYNRIIRFGVAMVILSLLAAYSMYFPVREGFAAVVTRFGDPVRVVLEPGPNWKLPGPIEKANVIDTRRRIFNTPYTSTFTRDKKSLILLTYVVWRVDDPLAFLQAAGSPEVAEQKLSGMVTAAKNFQLGRYDLTALISIEEEEIKTEAIEQAILTAVQDEASKKLGVTVEQVGFERVAFPGENMNAVLENMRAERQAEANRLRAEGARQAQAIRDDAHVESEKIVRAGRIEAAEIQAKAEREAADIYATAFSESPDFYRFWSSLQALREVLREKATIVLRSDRAFFGVLDAPSPKDGAEVPRPPLAAPEKPTNESPGGDAEEPSVQLSQQDDA